ncbi:MAG: NAD-dependent epimerase [Planctomycetes bacterium]|jgi:UDP-glucuronate 4-epimerase|nr:NAD-dependent epimerase [Planctomycetota bacterium]MCP4838359.1 NAD-dependent epimerase [Planctomycetota bacterium]
MHVLVTGAAGFIGSFTALRLLERGDTVLGLDNLNAYYDPALKQARLDFIGEHAPDEQFTFIKADLSDRAAMERLFADNEIDRVIHLGAQAGVRYSIEDPHTYCQSNLVGTLNVLEGCRHNEIEHLVYASTSSVFGSDTAMPFSTHRGGDHPMTFYAASKRANELMAHSYSNLFGLPCTGLRFFTVYGPMGRPDMALFKFTKAILEGRPIDIYNHGNHERDFTYIDDIVEGVIRATDRVPTSDSTYDTESPDPCTSNVPWKVYNIGNGLPVKLMQFIEVLEEKLGRTAEKNMLPMQPGDVLATWADTTDLEHDLGYKPSTSIETGVSNFVDWYLKYYK